MGKLARFPHLTVPTQSASSIQARRTHLGAILGGHRRYPSWVLQLDRPDGAELVALEDATWEGLHIRARGSMHAVRTLTAQHILRYHGNPLGSVHGMYQGKGRARCSYSAARRRSAGLSTRKPISEADVSVGHTIRQYPGADWEGSGKAERFEPPGNYTPVEPRSITLLVGNRIAFELLSQCLAVDTEYFRRPRLVTSNVFQDAANVLALNLRQGA